MTVEEFPPAAPDEPMGFALMRICDAVRLLLQRHYDGEIRGRGVVFLQGVFGELLSMAIGIELANCQEPEALLVHRLEQITEQLSLRIHHYQVASEVKNAANQAEPGEPSPSPLSRLH